MAKNTTAKNTTVKNSSMEGVIIKEELTIKEAMAGYDWWLQSVQIESWAFVNNLFTDQEIEKINNSSLKSKTYLGDIGSMDDAHKDLSYRNSHISNLKASEAENEWIFERITGAILHINEKFWNFELNRIETLQHSIYSKGQFYKPHIDMSYRSFNRAVRKLSFSVQLSDSNDYEGGDLAIITGEKPDVTSRKKGTIVFFPSYILHEVTPVTKGTRKALVGWVTGSPFK